MTSNRLRSLICNGIGLLALAAPLGPTYAGIGDIDPSYGINGKLADNPSLNSSGALLADGGVVSSSYNGGILSVQVADPNGLPDPSFGPAGERAIDLRLGSGQNFGTMGLPDGDVLVALSALPQGVASGSEDAYLVRIRPDGTLNSSFGTKGVWRAITTGQWGTGVQAMQAQPDGKILVALATFDQFYGCGTKLQLSRLLPDGSADLQFGNQGVVSFSAHCYTYDDLNVSLLPGGYIVVYNADSDPAGQLLNSSGTTVNAPSTDLQSRLALFQHSAVIPGTQLGYMAGAGLQPGVFSIARLRSDLTPDTSFGSQGTGIVSLNLGSNVIPLSLAPGTAVSASGQHIYGIGSHPIDPSAPSAALSLFRLNSDGTLDQQFGIDGVVGLDAVGAAYSITDTLEQQNGAVLIRIRGVGVMRLLGSAAPSSGMIGFSPSTSTDASGAQDATVITLHVVRATGSDGAVSIDFHTEDGAAVAGRDYLATSGTLNWDNGDVSDRSITIQLLRDAAITSAIPFGVVLDSPTGGAIIGNSSASLYINPPQPPTASTPVASTSANATATATPAGGGGAMGPIAVLVLLTVVAWNLPRRGGGRIHQTGAAAIGVLALVTHWGMAYPGIGDLDPTYGVGGKFAGYPSSLSGALLADGGAVSAVYSGGTLSIQFVDGNGLPDTHVGPAGERLIALGLGTGRDSGAIGLPGGDVLVALHALPQGTATGTDDAYLVRVRPDGALNPSFGNNGIWRMAGSGRWGTLVSALMAQADGKILVALGSFDDIYDCAKTMQLRRLLSDGSADLQFGSEGVVTLSPACYGFADLQLSPLPGGFLAVGNPEAGAQEQLLDGAGTATEAPTVDLQNRLASFQSSTVIPGTQLGYMAGPGQQPQEFSIVRLRSDLTPDTSFGIQGTGFVTLPIASGLFPQSLAPGLPVSASGHIYGIATGTIAAQAQNAAPALFRLNGDGTIDREFGVAGIVRLNSIGTFYNVKETLEQDSGGVLLRLTGIGVVRLLGRAAPSPGTIGFGPTLSAESLVADDATGVTLTVVRSAGSNGTIGVNFHTEDIGELAGRDYQAASGTLTWGDGDVSDRSITIALLKTSVVVGTTAFRVVLDSPAGRAIIGSANADISMNPFNASTSPPTTIVPSPANAATFEVAPSNGGGGAVSPFTLLALLTIASWRPRRRCP